MQVLLETHDGEIAIEVFDQRAPTTATYFLDLIDHGHYNGATFYRSSTLGVDGGPRLIQGGLLGNALTETISKPANEYKIRFLEEIDDTTQTGLRHRRGTVSLARDLIGNGAVLPEIFICLGDFPQLDFGGRTEPDNRGFPAFGEVIRGLEIVEKIAASETKGKTKIERLKTQILTRPVTIQNACRA